MAGPAPLIVNIELMEAQVLEMLVHKHSELAPSLERLLAALRSGDVQSAIAWKAECLNRIRDLAGMTHVLQRMESSSSLLRGGTAEHAAGVRSLPAAAQPSPSIPPSFPSSSAPQAGHAAGGRSLPAATQPSPSIPHPIPPSSASQVAQVHTFHSRPHPSLAPPHPSRPPQHHHHQPPLPTQRSLLLAGGDGHAQRGLTLELNARQQIPSVPNPKHLRHHQQHQTPPLLHPQPFPHPQPVSHEHGSISSPQVALSLQQQQRLMFEQQQYINQRRMQMEQQRTAMEQRSMERAGPLLTAGEASQGTRLTAADSNEQSRPDASRKRRADHEIIEVD